MWAIITDGTTLHTQPTAPDRCVTIGAVCYPPNSPLWTETPDPVPTPEPVDPLAEGRAALSGEHGSDIRAAVLDFLGYCGTLYAVHGIAIMPGMTFSQIRGAVTGRYPDVAGDEAATLKNMTIRGDIADELWLRWDRLCYHLGDLQTTERVVGQIVALTQQQ